MSCANILKALYHPDITAPEKCVLMHLANRANARTQMCWWSIRAIAEALGFADRTVHTAITRLETRRLIRIDRKPRRVNHYYLQLPPDPVAEPVPAEAAPPPAPDFTFKDVSAEAESADLSMQDMQQPPPSRLQDMQQQVVAHGGVDRQDMQHRPPFNHAYVAEESPKKESPKEGRKTLSERQGVRVRDRNEHPAFDEWWKAYPRKEAKPAAARAYAAAVKRGNDPETLLAGLRRFRFSPNPKYQPHPATWLNGDRWADEVEHPDAALMRIVGLAPPRGEPAPFRSQMDRWADEGIAALAASRRS